MKNIYCFYVDLYFNVNVLYSLIEAKPYFPSPNLPYQFRQSGIVFYCDYLSAHHKNLFANI